MPDVDPLADKIRQLLTRTRHDELCPLFVHDNLVPCLKEFYRNPNHPSLTHFQTWVTSSKVLASLPIYKWNNLPPPDIENLPHSQKVGWIKIMGALWWKVEKSGAPPSKVWQHWFSNHIPDVARRKAPLLPACMDATWAVSAERNKLKASLNKSPQSLANTPKKKI